MCGSIKVGDLLLLKTFVIMSTFISKFPQNPKEF